MKIVHHRSIRQMLCPITGKVIHFTAEKADAVAVKRGRQSYKCDNCQYWHTGNHKRKKRKKHG